MRQSDPLDPLIEPFPPLAPQLLRNGELNLSGELREVVVEKMVESPRVRLRRPRSERQYLYRRAWELTSRSPLMSFAQPCSERDAMATNSVKAGDQCWQAASERFLRLRNVQLIQ